LGGCVGSSAIRTIALVHTSGNSYTFDDGYGTTGSFLVNTTASSATAVGTAPITVVNFASSILTNFATQKSMDGTLAIAPRPVAITSNNVAKVYDGLLSLPGTALGLGNRVGSDNVTVSGIGVLADKNVGSNKSYTHGTLGLVGRDAGNYYFSSNTFSASNAGVHGVHDDRIAGVAVNVLVNAHFASPNATNAIAVALDRLSLSGIDALNYVLPANVPVAAADITPQPLTVTGSSAADKVYDATPFTSGVAGTLQGLVGTETLLASVNYARFNDAHAGSNKAVTLHYALADASGLASNYSVSDGATTASISRRPVSVAANAQSKDAGQSDPALTYVTEAATAGTGLVAGEQLAGAVERDLGEAVGAYRINQGGLNNANNPDYAVTYQSAQLAIHATTASTPPALPTPPQSAPLASPLPALVDQPNPMPESRNSSGAGRGGIANPGTSRQATDGTLTELGILAMLVSKPQSQAYGLIVVEIPRRMIDEGRSLNFPLPQSVADNLVPLVPLRITNVYGQDMPAWLRYDRNARHFVATRVPQGALPLQLILESGGKRWLIQVTQRYSV
jgi:hypothetical protein